MTMNNLTKYRKGLIDQISNTTILGMIESDAADDDYGNPSWGFRCRGDDGVIHNVWIEMDDEGNGPGAISIEKAIK